MKKNVSNWPPEVGKYKVCNPKACVAVCTLADLDIIIPETVAIFSPARTKNLGIEKIIKNIVSNPDIRYLILCGSEPKGHFVGQAIISLMKNGIDEKRKIIGAKGAMPYLKNAADDEIEMFKKQVEIIDLIGVTDAKKIEDAVNRCIYENPGAFVGAVDSKEEKPAIIYAEYDPEKQWTADDKYDDNWFTIFLDRDNKQIVVEHYTGYGTNNKLCCKVIGKTAAGIAGEIVKRNKVGKLYNAAYLGKELQKAEIALQQGKEYEQEKSVDAVQATDTTEDKSMLSSIEEKLVELESILENHISGIESRLRRLERLILHEEEFSRKRK